MIFLSIIVPLCAGIKLVGFDFVIGWATCMLSLIIAASINHKKEKGEL